MRDRGESRLLDRFRGPVPRAVLACLVCVSLVALVFLLRPDSAEEDVQEEAVADPTMYGMESPAPFVESDVEFVQDLLLHRRQSLHVLNSYEGDNPRIQQMSSGLATDFVREEQELVQLLQEWGKSPETEFDAAASPGGDGFLDPRDLEDFPSLEGGQQDTRFIELMLENQRSVLRLSTEKPGEDASSEVLDLAGRASNQATPMIMALEGIGEDL